MLRSPEEIEYQNKKKEVLDKFSADFLNKKYNTDACFRTVMEMLIRDSSPYEIIEKLIEGRAEMITNWQEYLKYHGQPTIIPPNIKH